MKYAKLSHNCTCTFNEIANLFVKIVFILLTDPVDKLLFCERKSIMVQSSH